jgi:hypothetical protein
MADDPIPVRARGAARRPVLVHHLGGADGVDIDLERPQLNGEGLHVAEQAMLGGDIVGVVRFRFERVA